MKIEIEEILKQNKKVYVAWLVDKSMFSTSYIGIKPFHIKEDGTHIWFSLDDLNWVKPKPSEFDSPEQAIDFAKRYILWLAEENFKNMLIKTIKTGRIEV